MACSDLRTAFGGGCFASLRVRAEDGGMGGGCGALVPLRTGRLPSAIRGGTIAAEGATQGATGAAAASGADAAASGAGCCAGEALCEACGEV